MKETHFYLQVGVKYPIHIFHKSDRTE